LKRLFSEYVIRTCRQCLKKGGGGNPTLPGSVLRGHEYRNKKRRRDSNPTGDRGVFITRNQGGRGEVAGVQNLHKLLKTTPKAKIVHGSGKGLAEE